MFDRNSNQVEIKDTSSFQASSVRLWPPRGPRIATLFPFHANLPRIRTPGRSIDGKEAPEAWQTRQSEAPDAGQGADSSMDEPFTHGRSKS